MDTRSVWFSGSLPPSSAVWLSSAQRTASAAPMSCFAKDTHSILGRTQDTNGVPETLVMRCGLRQGEAGCEACDAQCDRQ